MAAAALQRARGACLSEGGASAAAPGEVSETSTPGIGGLLAWAAALLGLDRGLPGAALLAGLAGSSAMASVLDDEACKPG